MMKIQSMAEAVSALCAWPGKTVYDIGCGTGDLVRWMTEQGALVTGLDSVEMLVKAMKSPKARGERYVAGGAERLPFKDGSADLLAYIASLHHVAQDMLEEALCECARVLKPGGRAVFIEPVAVEGAYCEITRLTGDESVARAKAYETLKTASRHGLEMTSEDTFYFERSFEDYIHLIETFVGDAHLREEILAEARRTTERLAGEAGVAFDEFRFKSVCRLNVFNKKP